MELLTPDCSPEKLKRFFGKDVHVCIAAFILRRVVSLTCDIHCGFGKVILKMELKET